MSIKNRDGSTYKLTGPNPMMKNQSIWGEDFQIHNMRFSKEIISREEKVEPINTDFNLRDNFNFTQELQDTKPEIKIEPKIEVPKVEIKIEPKIEPKTEKIEPKIEPKEEGLKLPKGVKTVFCYCLPAILRDRRDGVYGSKYQTIQYKDPFSFEMVIVEEDDFYITIWTTKEIDPGSILYPRKVDKDGRGDVGRWWRVQNKEPKTGGWLITSHPSDYHPSFELVS